MFLSLPLPLINMRLKIYVSRTTGLPEQLLFFGRFWSRGEEINVAGDATEQDGDHTEERMLRRTWVSGLSTHCPLRVAVSRVKGRKATGGDVPARRSRQWGFWGAVVLGSRFTQPAAHSQHGEPCSPGCKVNPCERTTGMCLLYTAKHSRLQRVKISSGKTHGLE